MFHDLLCVRETYEDPAYPMLVVPIYMFFNFKACFAGFFISIKSNLGVVLRSLILGADLNIVALRDTIPFEMTDASVINTGA